MWDRNKNVFTLCKTKVGNNISSYNELYFITTNKSLGERDFTLGGMHGYDPQYMDMHGIFYAYGPMFNQNMKIDTFELIHIYPLLCEMLNIDPYEDIDGKLSVLKHILN